MYHLTADSEVVFFSSTHSCAHVGTTREQNA